MRCALVALRAALGKLDLRFARRDTELAFRQRLRERSWFEVFACLIFLSLQLALLLGFEVEPFSAGIFYLVLQGIAMLLLLLACLASLALRLGCVWPLEAMWTCAIAMSLVAANFHSAPGRSLLGLACEDTEISMLLTAASVSIFCQVLSTRCCFLLPLVVLAMASITFQACGTCEDVEMQLAARFFSVLTLSFFLGSSYGVAHELETKEREAWLRTSSPDVRLQETEARKAFAKLALARELGIFKAEGCVMVLALLEDLRVSCAGRQACVFFEKKLLGCSFLSLLDVEDQAGFVALCRRASSWRLARMVATMGAAAGELLVFYRGHAERHFLVGIRLAAAATSGFPTTSHVLPSPSQPPPPLPPPDKDAAVFQDAPSPRISEYSGFDTEGSEVSFTCTESEGSSEFSRILFGEERNTQTDFGLGTCEQEIQTTPWEAFHCRCHHPPSEALCEEDRAAIAMANFQPKRRRKTSSFEAFTGTWILEPQFLNIAQPFIHRLTFQKDRCIDAKGEKWKVTKDGNTFYFVKGRIWISGGRLFREGKSGIVMSFRRAEECDLQRDEEADEADALSVLEQMISEG